MVASALPRLLSSAAACVVLLQCTAGPAREPVQAMREILGEWDIVEFDGHRPPRLDGDGQRHAYVDIAPDGGVSFAIECNHSGMRASVENSRLVPDLADDVQTAMGCSPEFERRDEKLFAFFRAGPELSREGERLVLSRGSDRLLLERTETRRGAALLSSLDDIAGEWTAEIIYEDIEPGHNRNILADLDGGSASLTVTSHSASLALDCDSVTAAALLSAPGSVRFSNARRTTEPPCRLMEADRDLALSLIASEAEMERVDARRFQIVSGRVRAVFARRHAR